MDQEKADGPKIDYEGIKEHHRWLKTPEGQTAKALANLQAAAQLGRHHKLACAGARQERKRNKRYA